MSDRGSRQSFLGSDSGSVLDRLRVGIVGLGGGGSHLAQQLAHVGVGRFILIDPDCIEESNLNRLVGGTVADVEASRPKVEIAARVITGVQPTAQITSHQADWRACAEFLRTCDLVLGSVDTYGARAELETLCRRYLMPYIDLGMDVHALPDGSHLISGQVIRSMPGHACMRCLGFIRPELLEQEAARYGDAGERPQIVWPLGLLASTAVGLALELFVHWGESLSAPAYLEYDGNRNTLDESQRLHHAPRRCIHFDGPIDLGDPWYRHASPVAP